MVTFAHEAQHFLLLYFDSKYSTFTETTPEKLNLDNKIDGRQDFEILFFGLVLNCLTDQCQLGCKRCRGILGYDSVLQ